MSKYANIQLEMALLNACIEINNNIDIASSILKPEDFSSRQNAEIFEYLQNQRRLRNSVDLTQLKLVFNKTNAMFWTELEQQNWSIDVESYAKTLKNLSIKDQLNALLSTSTQELVQVQDGLSFSHELNSKIYAIAQGVNNNSLKNSRTAVNEFLAEIKRVSELLDRDLVGLDTGFSLLNHYTKGLKSGELIIIAARPGFGKTTLALNIILNVLKRDTGVVFYSLETEAHKIMSKLIALNTGVSLGSIINASFTSDEAERIQNSANWFSEQTFYIYDNGDLNIEFLRSSLRRLKEEHPEIGLCVLDYIQLMNSLNARADRHIQVSEISRGLKLIALELKIPIIALSQVNRSVDSRTVKRLMLSDLRESGSIEQDADLILFINPYPEPNPTAERHVIIDIAKNRSGELRELHFDFKASKARFAQIEFRDNTAAAPSNTEEF